MPQAGHFFFSPCNKYLTKYLHVSPLVASAALTYFFFEEKLHFFV